MPYKDPAVRRAKMKAKYHSKTLEERRAYQKEYYQRNKAKLTEANRKRYAEQRDVYYERLIKTKYGMTVADYDIMFEEQGGVCKICEQTCTHPQRRVSGTLSIDHCHTTGKVRGLLCSKCNTAIGYFGDSTNTLKRAIDYLEASHS